MPSTRIFLRANHTFKHVHPHTENVIMAQQIVYKNSNDVHIFFPLTIVSKKRPLMDRPLGQADPMANYLVHTQNGKNFAVRWIQTFLLEPAGLVSSSSPSSADAFTASLCIRLCRNSKPSPPFPLPQTLRGFTATAVPRNATLRDALTAELLLHTAVGDHCTAVAAAAPADATAAIAKCRNR